jgi:hypothetical protein
MLAAVVALLVTAVALPSVAGAAKTKNCGGPYKIHAHGLSCKKAKKAVKNGGQGYTCKQVGQTKKPPFTIKCTKNGNKSVYYTYKVNGG